MKNLKFGRVITAMLTPFKENGDVDYDGAVALGRHLIEHGSEGLLVGGTTGEGAAMTAEEKLKLYTVMVNELGRNAKGKKVPIIGNTGTISTAETVRFTKEAEKTGIDAALVIVPYYVKPNQEGIYKHFVTVAKSTNLPIFIYNVPGRVGVSIAPETVKKIADECPNVIGIKDATGSWDQVCEEKTLLPDDFQIYSGDDDFTLAVLAAGGIGVISVASHIIGDDLLQMVKAFEEKDLDTALKLQLKMRPLMKGMFFTSSPVPVKTACRILGLPSGSFRLPMADPTEEQKQYVMKLLKDYGGLI